MFTGFFHALRNAGIPVTLREYLTLLEALERGLPEMDVENFYYLSRSCLVKDERFLDRFDQVFGHVFQGLEDMGDPQRQLPEAWLRRLAARFFTPEEMAKVKSLGGWDALMDELRKRLQEQERAHGGGSKWIGTGGTSPFGAWGYNPMGVRVGQHESRHRRAVKVWDKREFRNFDDSVELGTRNMKVALRRLRRFVRQGTEEELDLPDTIRSTAKNAGYLDLRMVAARENAVKVLLFLDVGGSMDDHVFRVEELFSAVRSEFKHLEHFYFHNCLYERVWKDNRRRFDETTPTAEILRTYGRDYKVIFVGDASMNPYEIMQAGASVEHWNEESGHTWMRRVVSTWPKTIWLNPVPEAHWGYTYSVGMIQSLVEGRMYGLTLEGLEAAMRELS